MTGQINRHGEGSLTPLVSRGKEYGYRVVFMVGTKARYEDFLATNHGTLKSALKAASKYYDKELKALPKVYGLPLRQFETSLLYPSLHLPHGVSYRVARSTKDCCYYLLFQTSLHFKNGEKPKKLILSRKVSNDLTEKIILKMQDLSIDARRETVLGETLSFAGNYVARGWIDRTPVSKLRVPDFSYMDIIDRAIDTKENHTGGRYV